MPIIFLERLPLPNLKTYTCASVFALSACIYYATYVVRDPDWNKPKSDLEVSIGSGADPFTSNDTNNTAIDNRSFGQFAGDAFSILTREPICVWVRQLLNISLLIILHSYKTS